MRRLSGHVRDATCLSRGRRSVGGSRGAPLAGGQLQNERWRRLGGNVSSSYQDGEAFRGSSGARSIASLARGSGAAAGTEDRRRSKTDRRHHGSGSNTTQIFSRARRTQGAPAPAPALTSARGVATTSATWLSGWTLKFVVGGAIAASYVLFQSSIRSAIAQRWRINKRLRRPFDAEEHRPLPRGLRRNLNNLSADGAAAEPGSPSSKLNNMKRLHADLVSLTASRPELPALRRCFEAVPGGPMVVVGPDGSGRTSLLREVLEGRESTVWMDLKENPTSTGEQFLRTLLLEVGYRLPLTDNPLSSLVFALGGGGRGGREAGTLSVAEVEDGLARVVEVLEREKASSWRHKVPVFCFDDLHLLGEWGEKDMPPVEAPAREQKTRRRGVEDSMFSKFLEWLLFLSDSKLAHIVVVTSQEYAHGTLDAHTAWRNRRNVVMIDYMNRNMISEHLSQALVGSRREFGEEACLSQEAIDVIVQTCGGNLEHLDRVLIAVARGESYQQTLRKIIQDALDMIEQQLDLILCQAAIPAKVSERQDSFDRYLRVWGAMEAVKNGPVPHHHLVQTVFNEHAYEIDRLIAAHMLTFVSSGYANGGISADEEVPTRDLVGFMRQSVSSRYVGAGTPLMAVAFRVLLEDPAMATRTRWVRAQQQLSQVEHQQKQCEESRAVAMKDRGALLSEMDLLTSGRERFVDHLGAAEFDSLLARIKSVHEQELNRVLVLNKKRDELDTMRGAVEQELEVTSSHPVNHASPHSAGMHSSDLRSSSSLLQNEMNAAGAADDEVTEEETEGETRIIFEEAADSGENFEVEAGPEVDNVADEQSDAKSS